MVEEIVVTRCLLAGDELVILFERYLEFYKVQKYSRAEIGGFLSNNLASGAVVLVASRGETLCGFVQLYFIPNSLSLGKMAILNDLFVAPEYGRNGVGTSLMESAIAYVRSIGVDRMELSTGIDNHLAQRLYESTGWRKISDFQYYVHAVGSVCVA